MKTIIDQKIEAAQEKVDRWHKDIILYQEQEIDRNCDVYKCRVNQYNYWSGNLRAWKEVKELLKQ